METAVLLPLELGGIYFSIDLSELRSVRSSISAKNDVELAEQGFLILCLLG